MRRRSGRRRTGGAAWVVLVLALVMGGCAGDPDEASAPDADDAPGSSVDRSEVDDDPAASADPSDVDEAEPETEPEDPRPPDLSVEVQLEPVVIAQSPIALIDRPTGGSFVAERPGTIRVLEDGGLSDPVLDLRGRTTTDGERGLLGLAVDEGGERLFVSFTGPDGQSLVTAYVLRDGRPDQDTERVLFELPQPYANHNGGDLHLGPDGMLWLGLGDGGGAGDPLDSGQDRTTPLGAIIRLDPGEPGDTGPADPAPDAPLADVDGADERIAVFGVRNPWRFAFDTETGTIWVADVGQGDREEVTVLPWREALGANLGWSRMEGTLAFDGEEPDDHVPPVYEYETGGPQGCAITGGVVYRGTAIPELVGAYLYADLCNGELRALIVEDGELVEQAGLGVDGGQVIGFGTDADGEVYVLDLAGAIHRLEAG